VQREQRRHVKNGHKASSALLHLPQVSPACKNVSTGIRESPGGAGWAAAAAGGGGIEHVVRCLAWQAPLWGGVLPSAARPEAHCRVLGPAGQGLVLERAQEAHPIREARLALRMAQCSP
jgi:hypothetical protein